MCAAVHVLGEADGEGAVEVPAVPLDGKGELGALAVYVTGQPSALMAGNGSLQMCTLAQHVSCWLVFDLPVWFNDQDYI
jgi:hypothetical protein